MTNTFDVKRRVSSLVWNGSTNNLLVGFQYTYDSMDNPLYERWLHDNGDYDQYGFDHRYELTGVNYRSPTSTPPASFANWFAYNDNLDRQQANFGGPFAAQPMNVDVYAINPADEYTNLTRNAVALNPAYDRAGNMTNVPVLPVTGVSGQQDVTAAASWDAMNCLYSVTTGVTPVQDYRYDPFRRRIATLSGLGSTPFRRFVYDGWKTVEERLFNAGATPASAPSTLERIYVEGPRMDEHLLTAIDRDGDGVLGPTNLNNMDIDADQWYYFLPNRLGSVTALLAANNSNQTLEYYRYTAYGEATVLPSVGSTNYNLSINFAQGWQRSSPEHGNFYFFTGQRFDDSSGLYYDRNRYYEPRQGRFLSRDPAGLLQPNLYDYVGCAPVEALDPLGLDKDDCKSPDTGAWRPLGKFATSFSILGASVSLKAEMELAETRCRHCCGPGTKEAGKVVTDTKSAIQIAYELSVSYAPWGWETEPVEGIKVGFWVGIKISGGVQGKIGCARKSDLCNDRPSSGTTKCCGTASLFAAASFGGEGLCPVWKLGIHGLLHRNAPDGCPRSGVL